jgi:hypothetical protein
MFVKESVYKRHPAEFPTTKFVKHAASYDATLIKTITTKHALARSGRTITYNDDNNKNKK